MRSFGSLQDDLNRNTVEFLRIDLDTALTLVRIAAQSQEGSERRTRNIRNARTAYDTVTRLRAAVESTPEQDGNFDAKLNELREKLEALGERFG